MKPQSCHETDSYLLGRVENINLKAGFVVCTVQGLGGRGSGGVRQGEKQRKKESKKERKIDR